MLSNIKISQKDRGFTIVELLIVIVVIGILAAITIVAYNGIQSRAKTSSGQALAGSVAKKMEALQAIKGSYTAAATGATTGAQINTSANAAPLAGEALIDVPGSVIGASSNVASGLSTSNADNGKVVSLWTCTAGANVYYLDFATTTNVVSVKAGAGC